MKQKHLWLAAIILLILLPPGKSLAQCTNCCPPVIPSTCLETLTAETPSQVIIDFKTKEIAFADKYLKPRTPVQIRIKNINPALYKIDINGSDSTVPSAVSDKLPGLFFDPSGISSIAGNLISAIGTLPLIAPATAQRTANAIADLSTANTAALRASVNMQMARIIIPPVACNNACQVENLLKLQGTLIQDLETRIKTEINAVNSDVYNYIRAFQALRTLYPDCTTFSPAALNNIHNALNGHRVTLNVLADELRTYQKSYMVSRSAYQQFFTAHRTAEQGVADSLILKFYSEARSETDSALKTISLEKEEELLTRVENMAMLESCYTSLPQFLSKNVKTFKIDIKPRLDSSGLPSYNTEFNLPWMQTAVFGLSAGVHIDGLVNQNTVVTTDSTAAAGRTYQIVEDNGSKIGLGVNAQAYYAWHVGKPGKPLFLGVSFGGGLSIESKPKPRFLLGAVAVLGEQQRFILSAGLIAGHVNRLSDQYKDKQFKTLPTDYTRDIIKGSVFFSLSYYLLGSK